MINLCESNNYYQCKHCHEWPAYPWKYSCGIHNGVVECLFANDQWTLARKRCKFYEENSNYKYKIVVECNGITVIISDSFDTLEEAQKAIPPWMIMDFVSVRKFKKMIR